MPTFAFSDVEGFAMRYYTDPATKRPHMRLLRSTANHLAVYEPADGDITYLTQAGGIWPEDKEATWTPVTFNELMALGVQRIEGIAFQAKRVFVGDSHACIDEITADGRTKHTCIQIGDFVRVQSLGKSYDGIIKAMNNQGFVLGWFDAKNHKQSDGFDWETSDILMY